MAKPTIEDFKRVLDAGYLQNQMNLIYEFSIELYSGYSDIYDNPGLFDENEEELKDREIVNFLDRFYTSDKISSIEFKTIFNDSLSISDPGFIKIVVDQLINHISNKNEIGNSDLEGYLNYLDLTAKGRKKDFLKEVKQEHAKQLFVFFMDKINIPANGLGTKNQSLVYLHIGQILFLFGVVMNSVHGKSIELNDERLLINHIKQLLRGV